MSELADLLKADLVALCEEKGLETDGTKADLIARLEALEEAAPAVEESAPEAEAEEAEPVVEESAPEPAPAPAKPKTVKGAPDPADESLSTVEFIHAAYQALLGREPDVQGLRHYKNGLDLHKTITRQRVLDDLLASDEYRNQ